ncbi:unnamed protein product [Sphagnum tenellum]
MDYTSMEDWFYGPPEPVWIRPSTYYPPLPPLPSVPGSSRVYVKEGEPPRTYYRVYPKVQTVVDRPPQHKPPEESRARVVEGGGPPFVVKELVKTPPAISFMNQPIELRVPMCCEKCMKKVTEKLLDLSGVEGVMTDQYNQKVIVTGTVDPSKVLNRVKDVKKQSVFWDQTVDYSLAYLKKKKDKEMAMIQAKKQADSAAAAAAAAAEKDNTSVPVTKSAESAKGPDNSVTTVLYPEYGKWRTPYEIRRDSKGPNVQVILPKPDDIRRGRYYQSDQAPWVYPPRYPIP